jgi:hypothetical protein
VLNPLEFALIGPVAAALGLRATLLGIGAFAVILPLSTLIVPGIRNVRLDRPAAPG